MACAWRTHGGRMVSAWWAPGGRPGNFVLKCPFSSKNVPNCPTLLFQPLFANYSCTAIAHFLPASGGEMKSKQINF